MHDWVTLDKTFEICFPDLSRLLTDFGKPGGIRCMATVSGYYRSRCSARAKTWENVTRYDCDTHAYIVFATKAFCLTHLPSRVKERQDKRYAVQRQESAYKSRLRTQELEDRSFGEHLRFIAQQRKTTPEKLLKLLKTGAE